MYCSNCGSAIKDNASFCSNCGHSVVVPAANQPVKSPSPLEYQADTDSSESADTHRCQCYCVNCGEKIVDGAKFCANCGTVFKSVPKSSVAVKNNYNTSKYVQTRGYTKARATARQYNIKSPKSLVIAIIAIIGIVVLILLISKSCSAKNNNDPDSLDSGSVVGSYSVVSKGVSKTDVGNIMNGQFYFATDDYIFYSAYDTNEEAHIFRTKKDGSDLQTIFNGFGWSLVVIDDWLYFSGNQGKEIDGTYNMFRVNLDGSNFERINSTYCYNMFLYGTHLYYMKKNTDYSSTFSICRSSLDGTNEETLFQYGNQPVIYADRLYYYDGSGNMMRTDPDGSNAEVLITADVKYYVISNEKLIYLDFSNNIKICELDGSENKTIREVKNDTVYSLNAYGDRIFFIEYNSGNFDYTKSGWDYTVKSMKFDGSAESEIFSSCSYGFYINIVGNQLMLLDYIAGKKEPASTYSVKMDVYINSMELDGNNRYVLNRQAAQ